MPLNSLISQAGLKLGPLVLETLVKHYLERALKDRSDGTTQLSQDELLYDEAFHIVKTFLEASTKHTVEELQEFSNTRTPSPPWTHVVRLIVPMSCCDDAATYLIQALGGEEVTKRVIGGTKWWQVRGVRGIDAEWLTAKKDWEQAKRRNKAQMKEKATDSPRSGKVQDGTSEDQYAPAAYEPEMDKMRCILFAHGGGYYFGSIDQERYSLERYARKIKGRIFAINYRLAPQYPFPCALQDFLAAYLFLIRPPEGASHQPVDPAHIVVAGDSAGGGMTIALLQIIRDTGLPMPAGGVLISPWCDLTHSFPSIHINTATDVLPPYGLSFHKPSTLWPPPPKELAAEVQRGIRSRVREALHMGRGAGTPMEADRAVQEASQDGVEHQFHIGSSGQTLHLGSTATLPTPTSMGDQTVTLRTSSGEVLRIEEQVQMYTPNNLLTHPLVSSVLSYLGGLPPLLVIASDKEVLRDEIIYFAHKAAHPDQHRVKDEAREMYPALRGIEERFGPTKVHLQVYDDAAHVLPTLFSFTTPAKYCYRAIASFCKYVTGMLPPPAAAMSGDSAIIASPVEMASTSNLSGLLSPSGSGNDGARSSPLMPPSRSTSSKAGRSRFARPQTSAGRASDAESSKSSNRRVRRTVSISVTRASSFFQRGNSGTSPPPSSAGEVSESGDVAGPRFGDLPSPRKDGQRTAGEASVYDGGLDVMIRERVATNGVIRPLEPESELPAMQFPEELIGTLSELVVRRYYKGRDKFSRKFTKAAKSIEKKRRHNLARAQTDTMRNMSQLQTYLSQDEHAVSDPHPRVHGIQEGMISAATWPWAWALDLDEEPPPSSIVARRDTEEARRLARIADQAFLADENAISGNNLWSVVVDFLTKAPHKHNHGDGEKDTQIDDDDDTHQEQPRSMLSRFMGDRRKGGAAAKHADRA